MSVTASLPRRRDHLQFLRRIALRVIDHSLKNLGYAPRLRIRSKQWRQASSAFHHVVHHLVPADLSQPVRDRDSQIIGRSAHAIHEHHHTPVVIEGIDT